MWFRRPASFDLVPTRKVSRLMRGEKPRPAADSYVDATGEFTPVRLQLGIFGREDL